MIFGLLLLLVACQNSEATPTLQPGEVEVPFETIVLAGEGFAEITEPPPLYTITNAEEIRQLQDLIEPAALQRLQAVNFSSDNLLALFQVPSWGCAGYSGTIERLVRKADVLTVMATDWQPPAGAACAQTNVTGYHIVAVSKQDVNLDAVTLRLERQPQEREGRLQKLP
ncbi:MAG: hypothetical protein KDE53_02040 [Caldilineaceae bacterium]|nr:hypothetical protein [Caldilineaceae bacterium]